MDTVLVFTAKDFDTTVEQGGSGNWKLNAERVKKCDYVVMTANAHHRDSKHSNAMHGHAFLVGKISGLQSEAYDDLGNKEDDRWIIEFNDYALVDIPKAWGGFQNPVKYTELSSLAIQPEALEWKPFPMDQKVDRSNQAIPALTIEEAKLGLSKKLGISPENIEITIRA